MGIQINKEIAKEMKKQGRKFCGTRKVLNIVQWGKERVLYVLNKSLHQELKTGKQESPREKGDRRGK